MPDPSKTVEEQSVLNKVDMHELSAIARRYGVDLIVLFGSQAKGRARPDSDIDIGVWFEWPQLLTEKERYERQRETRRALCRAFPAVSVLDLVFLNYAGSLLLRMVAETGIPLYRRDELAWPQFRVYANRRYRNDERYRRRLSQSLRKKYDDPARRDRSEAGVSAARSG